MNRKAIYRVIGNTLFLAAIIGVAYYLLNNSLKDIVQQIVHTRPLLLVLVIALGLGYQLIEGKLTQMIVRTTKDSFFFWDGFWVSNYAAFFRLITFGTGTLLSELAFYHRRAIHYSESIGISSLRITIYKLTAFFYAFSCLLVKAPTLLSQQKTLFWLILIGCAVTLLLAGSLFFLALNVRFQTWLMKIASNHVHQEKWRNRLKALNSNIDALRSTMQATLTNRSRCTQLFFISLLKFLFWYLIPFFIFHDMGKEISWLTAFSLISFATVLAGILPSPGGIGSFEFVFSFLFQPLVGTVAAISALLLYRLATYLLPFSLGFVYVLLEKRQQIRQEIKEVKLSKEE